MLGLDSTYFKVWSEEDTVEYANYCLTVFFLRQPTCTDWSLSVCEEKAGITNECKDSQILRLLLQ